MPSASNHENDAPSTSIVRPLGSMPMKAVPLCVRVARQRSEFMKPSISSTSRSSRKSGNAAITSAVRSRIASRPSSGSGLPTS